MRRIAIRSDPPSGKSWKTNPICAARCCIKFPPHFRSHAGLTGRGRACSPAGTPCSRIKEMPPGRMVPLPVGLGEETR